MSLLNWSLVFFILSGISAIFGFGNLVEGTADIAVWFFYLFATICIVLAIMGFTMSRKVT